MKFDSEEWKETSGLLDARLRALDVQNRNPTLSHDQTILLRGQMTAIRWLQEWPQRAQAKEQEPEIIPDP